MLQNPEFLVWVGILVGTLLAAALVLHFIDRWRRRQETSGDPLRESTIDLTTYREMYENGEITQSEYERIRDKLAAKMKREVGLADAGPAPAAPPESTPPPHPPEPPPAAGSDPSPAVG
jgi:hypothetical protein